MQLLWMRRREGSVRVLSPPPPPLTGAAPYSLSASSASAMSSAQRLLTTESSSTDKSSRSSSTARGTISPRRRPVEVCDRPGLRPAWERRRVPCPDSASAPLRGAAEVPPPPSDPRPPASPSFASPVAGSAPPPTQSSTSAALASCAAGVGGKRSSERGFPPPLVTGSHLGLPLPERGHRVIVHFHRVRVSRRRQGPRALEQAVQLWILQRLGRIPVRLGYIWAQKPAQGAEMSIVHGLSGAERRHGARAARERTGVVQLLHARQHAQHKRPVEAVLGAWVIHQPQDAQRELLRGARPARVRAADAAGAAASCARPHAEVANLREVLDVVAPHVELGEVLAEGKRQQGGHTVDRQRQHLGMASLRQYGHLRTWGANPGATA